MIKILDNVFVEIDKQTNVADVSKILSAIQHTLKPVAVSNGLSTNKVNSLHIDISSTDDGHGYRVITYMEQD